jgi:hypothetical protein
MKIMILAAFAALGLAVAVASAEPLSTPAPQQSGSQSNWTTGGAGWG